MDGERGNHDAGSGNAIEEDGGMSTQEWKGERRGGRWRMHDAASEEVISEQAYLHWGAMGVYLIYEQFECTNRWRDNNVYKLR